jgi:hypothetical protein
MRLQRIGQGFDPPPLHHAIEIHLRPTVVMRSFATQFRSRVTLLAPTVALLAACSGGAVSPDKALTMSVAEAAGGSLSGAALDRWLVAQTEAPNKAEASGLVSAWINDALLIDAVRTNFAFDDKATFDSVIMETAARTVVSQYFGARDALLPPVTDRQVDSVLDLDHPRVFQQIVLRVKGKTTDTAAINATKDRALQLHRKLVGGGDFTAAVREFSDDSISRANAGFLPAVTAAEMGNALAEVYNLAPNGISRIVASPVAPALIILRRATRQESKPAIRKWLAPQLARRVDSLIVDSIARSKGVTIPVDARLRTREMAREPVQVVDSAPFATWQGGKLPPAAVRNAILTLMPLDRYKLADAPDTVVTQFLTGLARREFLLPIAVTEPLPTAAVRDKFLPPYRHLVDSLKAVVGRLPANLSVGDAASMHIDSVLAQRSPFLPLPGGLSAVLRARRPVTVNRAVFDAIVRGAVPHWQLTHKDDSTTRARTAPPIKPAPGGPPKP